MIINDIEYNIRLYVDDEKTQEEIAEELFADFDEMNEFLEETWTDPEYENAKAEYHFVEVIDGKPESSGRQIFELEIYMPLMKSEIDDVLYDMRVLVPREQRKFKKLSEKNQMFSPTINTTSLVESLPKIPLSEYAYLCPHCLNELEKCICVSYPGYLIQVDRLLANCIRELNIKGYRTSSCCAGHPGYRDLTGQLIYVSFNERYRFSAPFPEGSRYAKEGDTLRFDIPEESSEWDLEHIREYQKDCIAKLEIWAEQLDNNQNE